MRPFLNSSRILSRVNRVSRSWSRFYSVGSHYISITIYMSRSPYPPNAVARQSPWLTPTSTLREIPSELGEGYRPTSDGNSDHPVWTQMEDPIHAPYEATIDSHQETPGLGPRDSVWLSPRSTLQENPTEIGVECRSTLGGFLGGPTRTQMDPDGVESREYESADEDTEFGDSEHSDSFIRRFRGF